MYRRLLAALLALALFAQPAAAVAPKLRVAASPAPSIPVLPLAVTTALGLSAAFPTPIAAVSTPQTARPMPAMPLAHTESAAIARAELPAARGQLQGFAADQDHALGGRLRFDGAFAGPADKNDPVVVPSEHSLASPKPEKRKGFLRRLNDSTASASRAEAWLERGLLAGVVAGTLTPFAMNAAPIHKAVLHLPASMTVLVLAATTVTIYRAVRFLVKGPRAARPPSSARKVALSIAAGLVLGAALGLAPNAAHAPFVEKTAQVMTKGTLRDVRLVRSASLEQAVIETLSANPVGKKIIDDLRDRFGVVRMPDLYLSNQDATASHMPLFDAVFIDREALRSRGISDKDLLNNPAVQRDFAEKFAEFFAHELVHAVQARDSMFRKGFFQDTIEAEWEAYLVQHQYVHEQLKTAPETVSLMTAAEYEIVVDDLDEYLKETHRSPTYKKNPSVDSERWQNFIRPIRAEWTAHRIEAYELLARKFQKVPVLRDLYQAKADALKKS